MTRVPDTKQALQLALDALKKIARGAPTEDPSEDRPDNNNHGDTAWWASQCEHWSVAQIARPAIAALQSALQQHAPEEAQERYEFVLAMCRDAQDMASRYGMALQTIVQWPCPQQDDMQSANMRTIARDALQSALQQQETREPVAWRVRGYAQFKTGAPGPWRYFDGAAAPRVNEPSGCDIEPLYASPIPQQDRPALVGLYCEQRDLHRLAACDSQCQKCAESNGTQQDADALDGRKQAAKKLNFTPEEVRRGYAMRGGVQQYCCYGMYCEAGHTSDCQYAAMRAGQEGEARDAEGPVREGGC